MTTPGTGESLPNMPNIDDDATFIDEPDFDEPEFDDSAPTASAAPTSDATDAATFGADLVDFFESRSQAPATLNFIYDQATAKYLAWVDPDNAPSAPVIEQQLLASTNSVIRNENAKMPKGDTKYPLATKLAASQVARILLRLHHVIRIAPNAEDTDREYDLLAMYQADGPGRGTYTVSEEDIRTTVRRYNGSLTLNEFKEVVAVLRESARRTTQSTHRDLMAVDNGIVFYGIEDETITVCGKDFHFESKKVHPFNPAFVFLTKTHIDYVDDAPEQHITHPDDGTTWDVVSWLEEMFDQEGQEGLTDLIWEIIGAIIRPHVRWGKTAWFYSEAGNNGKGTLCALMRNLVGPGAHTSIPLSDFGKDFALEPLVRANAVIVDENDVGTFIDKAANLKAIVTNDTIQINRKHRVPIAYQFWGFMVQCLNEFPRVKDKSDSFYRRQLFVPFAKSFTGAERKYIKDDYLQRKEVLEYVLWYAINRAGANSPGNYYELSNPLATEAVLAEYKEVNDPVRAFWEEFRERFVWDLLPFPFLYDLYKVWFVQVSPSGSPVSRQQFVSDLVGIVRTDDEWHCKDKNRKIRPSLMMNEPEPLIVEFELSNWYNPSYKGPDPDERAKPLLQANYRGIQRQTLTSVPAYATSAPPPSDTDDKDS